MSSCSDLRDQLTEYQQFLTETANLLRQPAVDPKEFIRLSGQLQKSIGEQDIKNFKQHFRELDYQGDLDLSHIKDHTQLQEQNGFIFPHSVSGNLDLSALVSAQGLVLPKIVGSLNLKELTDPWRLTLPKIINGSLNLRHIPHIGELRLPEKIGGDLNLFDLYDTVWLTLPEEIGGSLIMCGIGTAEGLEFPKKIGGHLELDITSAKGLKLPNEVGKNIYLSNLSSAEELVAPNKLGGVIKVPKEVYEELSSKLTWEELKKYRYFSR